MRDAEPDLALRSLLADLGAAMIRSGQPVDEVEDELREVGAAVGAPGLQVAATPTTVQVALASGAPATFQRVRGGLRLDQAAELRWLRYQLATGAIAPFAAADRLDALAAKPAAYPPWVGQVGFMVVATGICLILQPGWMNMLATAAGSVLVVLLMRVVGRYPSLGALLPTVAAFAVSLLVFGAAQADLLDGALRTVLPPLAVLLPGALLVTGLSELAAGAMVAGSARLLYGTVQLLLFAIGIAAAATLLSTPVELLGNVRVNELGWWGPPLGLLLVGLGIGLMESVPLRLAPWVFGVLALTFLMQVGGQELGAPVLGSFVAAVAASLGASVAEMLDRRVARLVVFLPSFWLLVPGSFGLLGVSSVAIADGSGGGIGPLAPAVVLAIAVGLLVGAAVARASRRARRSLSRVVHRPRKRTHESNWLQQRRRF